MAIDEFIEEEVESSYFEVGQYISEGKPFDFLDKVSNIIGEDNKNVYNMALDVYNYYKKNDFPQSEASHKEAALLTTYKFCLQNQLKPK